MFFDFGQKLFDGVDAFVLDGDDQVGGFVVEGPADDAGCELFGAYANGLDASLLCGPSFDQSQHEQSLVGGKDAGDSQVGPDDPAVLDQLSEDSRDRD